MNKVVFMCFVFCAHISLACDRLLAVDIAQKTVKELAQSMGASTFILGQDSLSDDGRDYHFIFSFKINNEAPSTGIVRVGTDSCFSSTKNWGSASEFSVN